jgi:hypothetical protein
MEPAENDPLAIAMDHARKVLFPRLARLMQEPTAFELGELSPPAAAQPVNDSFAAPEAAEHVAIECQ